MGALFRIMFLVVPVVEVLIFIWVQDRVGLGWTLAGIVITAVIGASLARRQGFKVWQAASTEVSNGRVPGRELAHGAMVIVGAALLLTPGYLTDALGFSLMVPAIREVVRRRGARFISQRTIVIR